jgi:hypothetical protein
MPVLYKRLVQLTLIAVASLWLVSPAISATPVLVAYQGRLTQPNGLPVADATYNVEFSLYSDSLAAVAEWSETAEITTERGLFVHMLGSVNPIAPGLLSDNFVLFLETKIDEEVLAPRTRLVPTPYAYTAGNLTARDADDSLATKLLNDAHKLVIFGPTSLDTSIAFQGGVIGDSAVILPDSSINSEEILDEPGITTNYDVDLIPLSTGIMTDLVTLTIGTPAPGYIVLRGKCYLMLSGTTGANSARIQIDDEQGGVSHYPHFTQAGLSGYVNTGINYFPISVIRVFYRDAGVHTFRMEGMAMQPAPATAETYDHVLIGAYYPTSYYSARTLLRDAGLNPGAVPVTIERPGDSASAGQYFDVDLRLNEIKAKSQD